MEIDPFVAIEIHGVENTLPVFLIYKELTEKVVAGGYHQLFGCSLEHFVIYKNAFETIWIDGRIRIQIIKVLTHLFSLLLIFWIHTVSDNHRDH